MQRKAFTLLELLVVVGILAILAVFLFGIFPHPHGPGNARRSTCQSNLKQIALGFKQYAQDADELFPRAALNPASATQAWDRAAYGWADALQPYLKSTSIFQCPSEQRQGNSPSQPWEAGYTDYYYNRRVSGRDETTFNNSANTVILGEGNDGIEVNDARYTHASLPSAWFHDPASPLGRHLDGSNYAFVDGHVKWLQSWKHPTTAPTNGKNFSFNS